MPEPTAPLKAWYKWKSLRLPWRKKWLCGYDLSGNTFWEFADPLNHMRPRRIVHYPRSTHYGDVALTPAWLQWLRKTRPDPPSISEQQMELHRQSNMRQLAARADQRWREQESFLDKPQDLGQPQPLMQPLDKGAYDGGASKDGAPGANDPSLNVANTPEEVEEKTQGSQVPGRDAAQQRLKKERVKGDNPWNKFDNKGPSEGWQPQGWDPSKVEQR